MKVYQMIKPVLSVGIIAIIVAGSFGCAAVPLRARKHLGDPIMQLNPDPMDKALDKHIFERREGSSGGSDAAGGGCGC